MYSPKQLDDLYDRLEAAVTQAMADGDYELAHRCASAIDAARKWEDSGFQGPPPPDVRELSGIDLMRLETGLSSLQPVEESLLVDLVYDEPEDADQFAEALEVQFERAECSLDSDHVAEAIVDLEVVIQRAHALQTKAQRTLVRARRIWQENINQAIDKARKHGRAQRRDFRGHRARWEAVLALDPANQEAQEAIREIETVELEQNLRATIDELRKPLQARGKRITDVEVARNKASELLASGQVSDPDQIVEIQEVCARLDELRNRIFKASEGGTSSERSQAYERAMVVYRQAILDGLAEIVDDLYGTPVDPVEALERTRKSRLEDVKRFATNRYYQAKEMLARGFPETASQLLEEAQEFLGKLEEDEELREQVNELLDQASHARAQKQQAEKLVHDAEKHDNWAEARLLLMQAKRLYPVHPNIDYLIEYRESLGLGKITYEMMQDIDSARSALYTLRFSEARQHCNQALSRGPNLEASNDELWAKRREAEQMLMVIAEREKNLADLLNKMAKIDQALKGGNLRLAQRLFDQLTPEERNSPEGLERLVRLQLAHEDAQLGEVKRAEQNTASPA